MGEPQVNYMEVPSVQELVKKKLVTIPSRYIRDDQDRSISSSNQEVPVIDMQRLINANDHNSMNLELNKLHFAAQEWGFFQLINHGVSSSVVEKMKDETQKFFDLPLEEKKKFEQSPGDTDGYGQLFVVSDEQKLDWADLFYLKTAPTYLRMPIFSKLPLSLRETIEEYSEEIKKLSMKVLEMLGKALGIEEEEVKSLFEEWMQSMRMNYYPACPQPEKIFSNGIYKSIEHRSVVSSEKERISVATFHCPRLDGILGPSSSFVTPHKPPIFKKVGATEYYRGYFTRELVGKSYVDSMRITSEDDLKN